jgi:uncharacterized protein YutD
MNFFKNEPININDIFNQSLWLNENIKINNNNTNKGINKIKDIINEYCNFLNCKQSITSTILPPTT